MTTADNQDQEIAVAATAAKEPGVGQLLREAREARNLRIEDMARHLRLSVRQVTALEEDDHDKLSGDVFLRGFIRNYARFVGIDAAPLLERLPQPSPLSGRRTIFTPVEGIPFPSGQKQVRLNLVMVVMVAGVLGFLGYEIYTGRQAANLQPQSATLNEVQPNESEANADATAVMTEARIEAEKMAQQQTETGVAPLPETPPPEGGTEGQTSIPLQPSSPVVLSDTPVTPVPAVTPPTGTAGIPPQSPVRSSLPALQAVMPAAPAAVDQGSGAIHFTFNADSWVEVRDANKKIIFSQFSQGKTEQVVRGKAPFSLTVGNAPGVKLVYNNKLVDLAPFTRERVAHVVLE